MCGGGGMFSRQVLNKIFGNYDSSSDPENCPDCLFLHNHVTFEVSTHSSFKPSGV